MTDDPTTAVPGAAELEPASDSGLLPAESLPEDGVPAKRDTRFKPGDQWSGNAKGRAKGVKNRITLERLLLEENLRKRLGVSAEDLLAKAVDMAMEGNDKIMRTLLDKLLATPKNSEDGDAKDNSVHVTINDLSGSAGSRPVATISKAQQTLTIPSAKLISGDSES